MAIPSWVSVNSDGRGGSVSKYNRAVKFCAERNKELKAQGQPTIEATEDELKALYVKFGGLLVGEESVAEVEQEEVEAPRRRTRKAE